MKQFHTIIIEDDRGVRSFLCELLRMRNHNFTTIPSPNYLYRFIEQNCNDQCPCAHFLLLDLYLADFYTLTWWKEMHEEGCAMPEVAMLSASWTEAEKKKAKEHGCKVFDKPFDIFTFRNWIAQAETSVQAKYMS